jgi:hypothetical protein
MNTFKSISAKPGFIIIITLIIGFLLGLLTSGYYTRQKIKDLIAMKTEKGFTSNYLKLIDPDGKQKPEVEAILAEYAHKNSQLVKKFSDSINELKLELQHKLEPKLNANQRKRFVESKTTLSQNNQQEIKKLKVIKIIQELKKDSISTTLIDSLKSRRKEIQKGKILKKIEEKIDERSLVLKNELNLNEVQFSAVNKLNQEYTFRFIALRRDSTLNQEAKILQLKQMRVELNKKMKAVLTPEQFEKYKTFGKEKLNKLRSN